MSDPYLGEIRVFGFNFVPQDWAFCNGATVPVGQYTALFSLLGTQFGGNGTSTFQLPNLAGRMMGGTGNGPGLTGRQIGETFGETGVTLTTGQMPQHSHALGALLGRGAPRSATPGGGNRLGAYVGSSPYGTDTVNGTTTMNPLATTLVGNNTPHNNAQPLLAMNPCIAINGVYPSFP